MKTERVFRAPGGLLPSQFWSGDEFSCVGGVEFAFMSATLDREGAIIGGTLAMVASYLF